MKTLLLLILCSYTALAHAATHHAFQGDVLRLVAPSHASQSLSVSAFGKNWPMYSHQGQQVAWIAIHLNTKPQTYPLIWQSTKKTWHDTIIVEQGHFRISHITVKKSMASFSPENLKRLRNDQKSIKSAYKAPVKHKNEWPEMIWPVEGRISTPFAAQRFVNKKPRSPHSGIDIAAPEGTAVHAPLAGIVLLVSDMYLNGNLVAIGHGDGLVTVYAHLKKALVNVGQTLRAGDVFAEVGSTGRSTGPHLHWGVHFSGAKINPRSMLHPAVQQHEQAHNKTTNEHLR